mmetsp:Transcript_33182/g.50848  ORF Transcript_33182/g.50848 Transcript_33182/m.50848 type:complete len:90 (-) Transcript_33182:1309-1578(-)
MRNEFFIVIEVGDSSFITLSVSYKELSFESCSLALRLPEAVPGGRGNLFLAAEEFLMLDFISFLGESRLLVFLRVCFLFVPVNPGEMEP